MLVKVFHRSQEVFSEELNLPIEFGRQAAGENIPYYSYSVSDSKGTRNRIVLAKSTEMRVISRRHALLEQTSDTTLRVNNSSETLPLIVEGRLDPLQPGEPCEIQLGNYFILGDRTVRLEGQPAEDFDGFASLSMASMPPGRVTEDLQQMSITALNQVGKHSENLLLWLRIVNSALQSAATASEFVNISEKTAAQIGGLDSARVLMRAGGPWTSPEQGWENTLALGLSRRVLNRITTEKRTIWQISSLNPYGLDGTLSGQVNSIEGVQALIAAPILNREGEVIGVLYGDRRQGGGGKPIGEVEAMLIEMVAAGLAGGLARLEEEQAALSTQVLFEQFFPPKLAKALQENPAMLEGRDAFITVLFCDVRGFSRISERLGPAETVRWMNDVMGTLSDCVTQQDGVLVDYVGDELMAMWGAPDKQEDHAERACLAALDMVRSLKILNQRWRSTLGETMQVGIGVNTGEAQVGNTGSRQKFKYGPLGNTVNLASRVQTATKSMNTNLLITDATHAMLSPRIPARRLHRVRVRNIRQTVELYELRAELTNDWPDLCHRYETALLSYEKGNFDHTLQNLGKLLAEHPLDGPTRMLLSRTTESMRESVTDFDPVWDLP